MNILKKAFLIATLCVVCAAGMAGNSTARGEGWVNGDLSFTEVEGEPDEDCTRFRGKFHDYSEHATVDQIITDTLPGGCDEGTENYGFVIASYKYMSESQYKSGRGVVGVRLPGESLSTRLHYPVSSDVSLVQNTNYLVENDKLAAETSLYVYPDITRALVPYTLDDNGQVVMFTLDRSQAIHITIPNSSESYYSYNVVASAEGKYVIVAYYDNWNDENAGFKRINMTSRQVVEYERNTGDIYRYDIDSDGRNAASVTMDGRYVIFGGNYTDGGNLIYDLSTCSTDGGVKKSCDTRYFSDYLKDRYGFTDMIVPFVRVKFIDNDRTLRMVTYYMDDYHTDENFGSRYYDMQLHTGLVYLALGDSISSGEGDTLHDKYGNKHYRQFTDVNGNKEDIPREKCHLSWRSYPYLLAKNMNLAPDSPMEWNSVACSGAQTTDIVSGEDEYYGQEQGSGSFFDSDEYSNMPRLQNIDNRVELQTTALNEFIPGRNEQIEFVKKYKPQVITLTAGANDIGFSDKLGGCVQYSSTCIWASDNISSLAGQIKNEYEALKSTYQAVYDASDRKSKIYVVGYPQLMNGSESAKCTNTLNLNKKERKMVVDATDYLNKVIKHAANAVGVYYIDISHALVGGRLCDDGQEYMNGIILDPGKNELQESFHPNDYGHIKITQAINKAVNNQGLYKFKICSNSKLICPKTGKEAEVPEVPESLGGVAKNSYSKKVTKSAATKGTWIDYIIKPFTFMTGSWFSVKKHSEVIDLGTFTANDQGGAHLSLQVPRELPAGYHTIFINGINPAGEPIELTQTILIKGENPDDIDEDGVIDSQEDCSLFIDNSFCNTDDDKAEQKLEKETINNAALIGHNSVAKNSIDTTSREFYINESSNDDSTLNNAHAHSECHRNKERGSVVVIAVIIIFTFAVLLVVKKLLIKR